MCTEASYVDYMSETVSRIEDQIAEHAIALDVLHRELVDTQLKLHALTREFLRSQDALANVDNDPVT